MNVHYHAVLQMANMDLKGAKSVPLVDRLDEYYEDVDMLKGKPNLVNFPPDFSPIPCKPLFFDIALNHVEFPSLDHKLESGGLPRAGPAGCQAGSGAGLGEAVTGAMIEERMIVFYVMMLLLK